MTDVLDEVMGGALHHYGIDDSLKVIVDLRDTIYAWHNKKVAWLAEPPELPRQCADDIWTEKAYMYDFVRMAAGQAFIGAIAPLYETLMVRACQRLCIVSSERLPLKSHPRVSAIKQAEVWDPRLHVSPNGKSGRSLLRGFDQVLDMIGASSELPSECKRILEALFAYRNKVLHLGYEWPHREGKTFVERIEEEDWKHWFDHFETLRKCWMISITKQFAQDATDAVKPLAEALRSIEKKLKG